MQRRRYTLGIVYESACKLSSLFVLKFLDRQLVFKSCPAAHPYQCNNECVYKSG